MADPMEAKKALNKALMNAACRLSLADMRAALEAGANPQFVAPTQTSFIARPIAAAVVQRFQHCKCRNGEIDCPHGVDEDPVTDATRIAALQLLQDFGADIWADEATDLLYEAVDDAGGDVVRFLATLGADVNGPGPLHRVRRASAARALIDLGASLTARTGYPARMSPLHAAARYECHVDVLRVLVCAGADLEALDEEDATPLMHAAESRETEMLAKVSLLLELGADPTPTRWDRQDALALVTNRIRATAAAGRRSSDNLRPRGLFEAATLLGRAKAWRRRRHMLLAIRCRE